MTILLHLIQVMELSPARGQMVARPPVEVCMGQAVRFQEILRRLAMIDEGFVEDQAKLGLAPVLQSRFVT
jgi:hypothetical protein